MRDLTKGPVAGHVLHLSAFIAISTLFQTLYFLVDLYFVGRLGKEAVAGVGLAGNLTMVVLALTQALGVGATALIAQAMGRRDRARAELVFNQTMLVSILVGVLFGIVTFGLRGVYTSSLAADATTAARSLEYLNWFIPALCGQFLLVGMGSALRGTGDLKVPTMIQIGSVIVNAALAPVLIFGWGTGVPLGVAGASLASLVAIAGACVAFTAYFYRKASHLHFRREDWDPQPRIWADMLKVGLPVGGEFAVGTFNLVFVYALIRPFGSAAQAGFGIGVRLMQSLFLPAIAIGFATAPVVGQNVGARLGDRVRATFQSAGLMAAGVMVVLSALCHIAPAAMIRLFNDDPAVVAEGSEYLAIVSWTFVASGLVFVSSSAFQGLGNTVPALASSALRLIVFVGPAAWLAQQPGFALKQIWYLSAATVIFQMIVTLSLLFREFNRRLGVPAAEGA